MLELQVYQVFQEQKVKQDELYHSLDLLGQMAFLDHLVSLDPKVTKGILGFRGDLACQEKKVLLGSQV